MCLTSIRKKPSRWDDKAFFSALKEKFKTSAVTTYLIQDEFLKPLLTNLRSIYYHFEQMKANGTFEKIIILVMRLDRRWSK